MNELRLIEALPLQSLLSLLADNTLPVGPILVQYDNYTVRNAGTLTKHPLKFTWQRGNQQVALTFALATWDTAAGRASPGSNLVLKNDDSELMGFSLAQLPQDDTHVLLGFKMGNGEGGKNRWFGRRRDDPRPADATVELARELKRAWQGLFPDVLPAHPTLGGEWLVLARLPLDDLRPDAGLNRRMALKTTVLQQLAHAFVVAEKLRDESFSGFESEILDERIPIQVIPAVPTAPVHPLNQILYGPPGTGKTYATAAWALALIENRPFAEIEARYRHDQRTLQRVLEQYKSRKQVRFVTFHQSFSYEDFVEGIKPNLDGDVEVSYKVEPGVFRLIADDATRDWRRSTPAGRSAPGAEKLPFQLVYDAYIADLITRLDASADGTFSIPTVGNYSAIISGVSGQGIISIRHSTGPYQYNVKAAWTEAAYQRYDLATDIVPMNKKMLEIGGPNATLQWAIFNDLKRYEAAHQEELRAQVADEEATTPLSEQAPNYVLIIDEINRGNVASIFGELITLLEDDKRAGADNALSITLPYSKETRPPFSVPPNLFVLGTMNTADRSVEALDTALRRRFSFVEMSPRPQLLSPAQMIFRFRFKYAHYEQPWAEPEYVKAEQQLFELLGCPLLKGENVQKPIWKALTSASSEQQIEDAFAFVHFSGVNLQKLLDTLNQRLEYLLGRDYCLGHAWLMRVSSLEGLQAVFRSKVIPQLQDFFPGNWGRLGQILGKRFVTERTLATSPLLTFGEEDEPEGRSLYTIRNEAWSIEDFCSIYRSSTVAS